MGEHTYRYGSHRFWEIVPGFLVWTTFVLAVVFSFLLPMWVVAFVIVFDLFWLFRVIYFVVYLGIAWYEYKKTTHTDWLTHLETIAGHERIHHLIFLPTYQEDIEIIRATLRALEQVAFPKDRMMIVLAGEARDHERFVENAKIAEQEFGQVFKRIFVTEHPMNLPDEVPGKGSNLNWAGNRVAELLAKEYPDLKDEDIVVSSFDVDTVAHPQYFAYLTYLYCTVPNPTRSSYQPVALFSNNIWTATAPVRVAAFGTTFWLLTDLARPDRLWTFSSHSMPWTMLKDVGFWQKEIVTEDSRIFMQAFVHYHGDYRVTPMFMPVSMDAVTGGTYREALTALYKQMRRWAWGVEHLPYMVQEFKRDKQIPLRKKVIYLFNHIEGMYTWATAPFLIFILGRLPLWLASEQEHAFIQAAPFTLEQIMQLAMIGVFASGILSLTLLPPRPKTVKARTWLVMLFQWALLPVTFIAFGALPAIDAQTRLMLGKYLGFNVTKKAR